MDAARLSEIYGNENEYEGTFQKISEVVIVINGLMEFF